MRLLEILNEMRIGAIAPNVTTADKSAPWVKKGLNRTYNTASFIKGDHTVKEKFEYLLNNPDSYKIHILWGNKESPSIKDYLGKGAEYNKETGNLIFVLNTNTHKERYEININDCSLDKYEKDGMYHKRYYYFRANTEPKLVDRTKLNLSHPKRQQVPDPIYKKPVIKNAFGKIIDN